jgi:predicted nucleic acid-binding protein
LTHLLDTSAALAHAFDEPGAERVETALNDPEAIVGISVLTLYEVWTATIHQSGSTTLATEAIETLKLIVSEVVPVTETTIELAIGLRQSATGRIALADCLIAATAMQCGATLLHRDPHFAALPGTVVQEVLPDKW